MLQIGADWPFSKAPYLLPEEQALRWQDGEPVSRTVLSCGVCYRLFVVVCALWQMYTKKWALNHICMVTDTYILELAIKHENQLKYVLALSTRRVWNLQVTSNSLIGYFMISCFYTFLASWYFSSFSFWFLTDALNTVCVCVCVLCWKQQGFICLTFILDPGQSQMKVLWWD